MRGQVIEFTARVSLASRVLILPKENSMKVDQKNTHLDATLTAAKHLITGSLGVQ
jgi:hypothetical protein